MYNILHNNTILQTNGSIPVNLRNIVRFLFDIYITIYSSTSSIIKKVSSWQYYSLFIFRKQCPCSPKARRKEQQTCPCSTDQTFAAIREAARQEGKCTPCAEPPPCPPCCGAATPKKFSDLITKETVKKCGCPVKDYSCNCCKSKWKKIIFKENA